MSRRDVLLSKLSATMDPDNARALLDEVICEADTRQILDDHIQALEFIRELTAKRCPAECGICLICRAEKWLHAEVK